MSGIKAHLMRMISQHCLQYLHSSSPSLFFSHRLEVAGLRGLLLSQLRPNGCRYGRLESAKPSRLSGSEHDCARRDAVDIHHQSSTRGVWLPSRGQHTPIDAAKGTKLWVLYHQSYHRPAPTANRRIRHVASESRIPSNRHWLCTTF